MSWPESARRHRRCAHEACGCIPPQGATYCGAYCSTVDANEPDDAACACGHAGCATSRPASHAGDETVASIGGGPGRAVGNG